jgi:hypothetical protein
VPERSGEDEGPDLVEVLNLRTFNWPMALFSLVFFGMAALLWLKHEFGSARGAPLVFACVCGVVGVMALFYGLLPLSLRADQTGLTWRQAGPKRSLRWSEIEGFGVWRDRSMDSYNNHPVVRFTRQQTVRPLARLMIRLTPEARQAHRTETLYQKSGYDVGLMLPVRTTLTQLEAELERRLSARSAG